MSDSVHTHEKILQNTIGPKPEIKNWWNRRRRRHQLEQVVDEVVAAGRGAAALKDQGTPVGAVFKEIHALAMVHEFNSGSPPRYNDLLSPIVHSKGDEPAGFSWT